MKRLELNKRNINKLKNETAKLISSYDFRYFITLNFNSLNNELKANYLIKRFINLLNAKVFGKRSSKSIILIASLERHKFEGYHVHILSEDPTVRIESLERKLIFNYMDLIKECWEAAGFETAKISLSCPDGKSWFKEITDLHGVADYICKEIDQYRSDVIQWDISNLKGRRYN